MSDKELTAAQKMVAANLENGSIAAFARGEEIGVMCRGAWKNDFYPNFSLDIYTTKPKPVELWLPELKSNDERGYFFPPSGFSFTTKDACENYYGNCSDFIRAVRFVQAGD